MKVIGFCGLPGAGKTTAIDAIKDLGTIITMGDVIRNELMKRKIEQSDENLGFVAMELRAQGGDKIIAEKCLDLINETHHDNVIFIDGLRSNEEVKVFRKKWKFPVIAIEANPKLRFERIAKRARTDDSKNVSEIRKRELREIGFGLEEVIKRATIHIINNGTIEDLKIKTRRIVIQILESY